jgi:hypothetical protein
MQYYVIAMMAVYEFPIFRSFNQNSFMRVLCRIVQIFELEGAEIAISAHKVGYSVKIIAVKIR